MRLQDATSVLELCKAFYSVPFDWLVKQAGKLGYNLRLLRLFILSYLLGTVSDIDGYCSVVIWVSRGIATGSLLATIELWSAV